jgi:hypothetical protein
VKNHIKIIITKFNIQLNKSQRIKLKKYKLKNKKKANLNKFLKLKKHALCLCLSVGLIWSGTHLIFWLSHLLWRTRWFDYNGLLSGPRSLVQTSNMDGMGFCFQHTFVCMYVMAAFQIFDIDNKTICFE